MATVTQRIKSIKQPRGGYLPIKLFKESTLGGEELVDLKSKNVHPSIIGSAVDYLTRFYSGGCTAEEAFEVSLKGARNLMMFERPGEAICIVAYDEKLSDAVIISACFLASLDVAYRAGPHFYNPKSNCYPNKHTIEVIRKLVERSLKFIETHGGVKLKGFKLDSTSYTEYINNGEGDFITEDGLWDMKVSVKKPDNKHTLQLMVYYLMGMRSESLMKYFSNIEKIGIYNPRLDKSYTLEIKNIDKAVIERISKEVIGY